MSRPTLRERINALLFYAGCLPAFFCYQREHASSYIRVHRNQALILFAFLGLVFLLLLFLAGALSYGMVYHRELVESGPTEVWLLSFIRKMLIVWVVFTGYAVFMALRGSDRPVPYMSVFTRNNIFQKAGIVVVLGLWIIAAVLIPLVLVADGMVTSDAENGSVFMVYENQERFPRALFSLAMLPIAWESVKHYGPDSVVLLPITPDTIQTALQQGVIVVLASHGTEKGILLKDSYFTPADIQARDESTRLKYVYFAGCDGGAQRKAWERALRPAQIYTYDRLTPVIEHLWWLWTQGPGIVREIAACPR